MQTFSNCFPNIEMNGCSVVLPGIFQIKNNIEYKGSVSSLRKKHKEQSMETPIKAFGRTSERFKRNLEFKKCICQCAYSFCFVKVTKLQEQEKQPKLSTN